MRIGRSFKNGDVSKDDYEKTLRAYTDIVNVMKSEQRSKTLQLRNQGLGTNTPVDDTRTQASEMPLLCFYIIPHCALAYLNLICHY